MVLRRLTGINNDRNYVNENGMIDERVLSLKPAMTNDREVKIADVLSAQTSEL